MITHILAQPQMQRGDGPIGLVLAPTRELAAQIHSEAKKFATKARLLLNAAGTCFVIRNGGT
jgi:superfamily II DNA/RNA helicase